MTEEIRSTSRLEQGWADSLRKRLKEASKGEPNTWGFVAMFMEMIEATEKELNTLPSETGMNNAQAAKAFEYADQCMFMRLEGEGCPLKETEGKPLAWSFSGEDLEEVSTLADASESMREAYEWLSARGIVTLESDLDGEYVVLTEKGCQYAQR